MAAGEVNKWLGGHTSEEELYTTVENWSKGEIPLAGEHVVFDGDAGDDEATGEKYNCDCTGMTAIDLASLRVLSGYDGDIGDSTNKLDFNVEYATGEPDKVVYEGSGTAYFNLSEIGSDFDCSKLVVNATGALYIYSNDYTADGGYNDWGEIFNIAGTLIIAANTIFESIYNVGASAITTVGATCNSDGTSADISIRVMAGTLTWDSQIGSVCEVYGGTMYWGSSTFEGVPDYAMEADLVKVYGSGIFYWQIERATSSNASVLKQFKCYNGGKIAVSDSVGVAGEKEIGSGSGEISELWMSAIGDFDNGAANTTFGTDSSILNYSGTLYTPSNEEISW